MKIIINAEGEVFGRLCSYAAKKALEGNEVIVVNSEKAIISGRKEDVIKKYKELRAKGGHSLKGPRVSKTPYTILKKGIRGMLPDHRKGQGKIAFKKVKCYDNIPEEYKEEVIKLNSRKPSKYIELKELSEKL